MFTFFGKKYIELRESKLKVYEKYNLHKDIPQEVILPQWPISSYPCFHSLTEFGFHLAGIILKPILCLIRIIINAFDAIFSLFISPISLLWWDLSEAENSFFRSIHCAAYVLYLLASMICDPILSIVSVAIRSIASLAYGLSLLLELTIIVEPKTPTIESFCAPLSSSIECITMDRLGKTSSSLEDIPLLKPIQKEEPIEWSNAPIL